MLGIESIRERGESFQLRRTGTQIAERIDSVDIKYAQSFK